MLEAALYTALGCAVISALAGNRAAWALVPSVAFCLWMQAEEIAFSPLFWWGIDMVVILLIVGLTRKLARADWAILALFPVAWASYLLPDPYRFIGSTTVTIAQLLLTFPAANVWKRIRQAHPRVPDPWDDLQRAIHMPGG